MTSIFVDKTKCKKDNLCIVECPLQILRKDKEGYPTLVEDLKGNCINCGHCTAICPNEAISLNGKYAAADYEQIKPDLIPSKESLEHLIKSRRSVRHYRKTSVDKSTIYSLVDIVRWVPSASNR